jgi:hypothetical protein
MRLSIRMRESYWEKTAMRMYKYLLSLELILGARKRLHELTDGRGLAFSFCDIR